MSKLTEQILNEVAGYYNSMVGDSVNEVTWHAAKRAYNKADRNDRWSTVSRAANNLLYTLEMIKDGEKDGWHGNFDAQPQLQRFIDSVQKIIDYCDRKEMQVDNLKQHYEDKFQDRFGMSDREMEDNVGYAFNNDIEFTPDQKEYSEHEFDE